MSAVHADRNLLYGLLALQMDFITQDDLIKAMQAWVLEKEKPIGQILQETGLLSVKDHDVLEPLLRRHLSRHQDVLEASLSAVSVPHEVQEGLNKLDDHDIRASVGYLTFSAPTSIAPLDDGSQQAPVSNFATFSAPPAPIQYSAQTLPPPPEVSSVSLRAPRFQILRPHARGGLGEVHEAHDTELHRTVALKTIRDKYADDPESRRRFEYEAEITGGLEHPGIVPVYSLEHSTNRRPTYAMRFIRGSSLRATIKDYHSHSSRHASPTDRTLQLRRLIGQLIDACNAVAYAHSRGVIHRDLKPDNIMVGKYGETLVVDWGLAKTLSTGNSATGEDVEPTLRPPSLQNRSETQTGFAIGTPSYMPPEQAEGRLDLIDQTSDVYSLGATLYAILVGYSPFQQASTLEILNAVRAGRFDPPRFHDPSIPAPLEAICLKAMAFRPIDRFQSATELAADLERWLADEPVSCYQEPFSTRLRRWSSRHRTIVGTVSAGVLAALVGLVVVLVIQENARQQIEDAYEDEQIANRKLNAAYEQQERDALELARQSNELIQTNKELEQKDKKLGEQNQALTTANTDLEVANTDLEAAKTDLEEANKDLEEALRVAYAILEGPLTGSNNSILNSLRVFRDDGATLTSKHMQARIELFRAIPKMLELFDLYYRSTNMMQKIKLVARYKEVLDLLRRAIEFDPDLGLAHLTLSQLLMETAYITHDWADLTERLGLELPTSETVLYHCDRSVQLLPNSSYAYSGRGYVRIGIDDEGALRDLEKAIELDPTNENAYEVFGDYYYHLGEHRKAIEYVMTGLRIGNEGLNLLYNNGDELLRDVAIYNASALLDQEVDPKEQMFGWTIYRTAGSGLTDFGDNLYLLWLNAAAFVLSASPEEKAELFDILSPLRVENEESSYRLSRLILEGFARLAAGRSLEEEMLRDIKRLGNETACEFYRSDTEILLEEFAPDSEPTSISGTDRFRDLLAQVRYLGDQRPALHASLIKASLAMARARAGDHVTAREIVQEVRAADQVSIEAAYNLICASALTSKIVGDDSELSDEERNALADSDRGIALGVLERIRDTGFFQQQRGLSLLQHDQDLNPLRDLRDFQMFVWDLTFPSDGGIAESSSASP